MPCKTKASPEEMLDQIALYLYQGVTITQAAENLHMSRITFRKWVGGLYFNSRYSNIRQ